MHLWFALFISKMVFLPSINSAVQFIIIISYQKCSFHQMTHVLITKTKNNIKIANDTIVEIKSAPYALPKSLNPQIFYYE